MSEARRNRFEALYHGNYRAVRNYVRRRAEPETAQDIVASTFLVAWRRLEDIPPDATPWLFGVARAILSNDRRAAARAAALVELLAAEARTAEASASDPANLVPDSQRLRVALATLSDSDRELLMLMAWEGLEPNRAAAALGCSRATLAVRLHRARRRLRRALELERHATPTAAVDVEITEA